MEPIFTLPDGAEPLHRRLYMALRQAILDGRLRPGSRLPPSRGLARDLGLARNTVATAYDTLAAEGYVACRVGAGSFVARTLPDRHMDAAPEQAPLLPSRPAPEPARRVRGLSARPPRPAEPAAFRPALPALDAFPWAEWGRTLSRRWRRPGAAAVHDDPRGWPPLCAAVADMLRRTRALRCSAEQVFITSGAQQGLDLSARLLLEAGDHVVVEDPGFPGVDAALAGVGAVAVPQPVDEAGMIPPDSLDGVRAVVVTPSRCFPLGTTLSLSRRLALLDRAGAAGAWVVEDDYDSDFRFDGRPVAALQGLDRDGRVVYLGTFNRAMFPGLRLGYVVVPKALVEPMRALRAATDGGGSVVPQAALADFMADGQYAGHLRAMRGLYAARHAALRDALLACLGERLRIVPADGGMHLTATLPPGSDDRALAEACRAAGLWVTPLSPHYRQEPRTPGLVLGFAALPAEQAWAAVERLARVIIAVTQ